MRTGTNLNAVMHAEKLPEPDQYCIAALNSRDPVVAAAQTILAGRTDLADSAAELLVEGANRAARRRALRNTRQTAHIATARGLAERAAVAANPHNSPETLEKLLNDPHDPVVLRAACNPSSPLEARRAVLEDPALVHRLVEHRSPVGAEVVRAGELTANNRWLLEEAERHSSAVIRGLTSLPECPADLLKGKGRWPTTRWHPSLQGRRIEEMTDQELAESPSAAAHRALLDRCGTDARSAARILEGHILHGGHARSRSRDPEPHIIAGLLRQYSGALSYTKGRVYYAGTRTSTTGWAYPYAEDLLNHHAVRCRPSQEETDEALEMLGGDLRRWKIFVRLVTGSHSGEGQLPEAAAIAAL